MKSLIKDICSRCPPPRILCGDFNAHHSLWGDKMVDARGKEIVDAMGAENLCVANDKKPTFFRPPNSTSVIDLVIHSADVTVSSTTALDRMGSDHFPIYTNVAGYQKSHQNRLGAA
ncbi:hypothetical protein HPB50_005099 [Hyalomma asiaticum]|uniref:Uncharacterized protein n=1 Tax=Hyalomma asiaticum TaxID=266040 RepID=A0ACB7SBY3_HYAAI|nr:hypothetical protein HPB50_005099 [Hyalomma asiaticum]